MATTGVKKPIGVIEVSGKFGDNDEYFQQFISPEDILIPSDLNYAYTRIPRHLYDAEVMDTVDFIVEFVGYMKEKPVDIVLVNNSWWLTRLAKDPVNRSLFPLFSTIGKPPIFPITAYETARLAADYTLFDSLYIESPWELMDHINKVKKQCPRGISCDIDCAYTNREGPDDAFEYMTVAQESVKKMVHIWESMLRNNQAQEQLIR
jgi:hypothetical protein